MGMEYVIVILMGAAMCPAYFLAATASGTSVAHASTDDHFTPNEVDLVYGESDCEFEDDTRSCCPFRKQLTSWEWVVSAANHERND